MNSWIYYVALEPYVRRRWPQIMIAWSRLLGGGVRDALVGGHVLIGIAMGIGARPMELCGGSPSRGNWSALD